MLALGLEQMVFCSLGRRWIHLAGDFTGWLAVLSRIHCFRILLPDISQSCCSVNPNQSRVHFAFCFIFERQYRTCNVGLALIR